MNEKLEAHLKAALQEARNQYAMAALIEEANDYGDAMESMERKYWEGQVDALEAAMDAAGIPHENVLQAKDYFICVDCREILEEHETFQDPGSDDIYCQGCRPGEGE